MDALIVLSRAFHAHRITAEEFRQSAIDAIATATADDVLSLAYFFADAEMDDDERDTHELIKT